MKVPFEKVNIKQIVREKKQNNPKFAEAYSEVEKEYELVRQIVRVRKAKRITQRELAQRVGVHQQVISRFEREKHIPTLTGFLKILNGLDLDLNLVQKDTKENIPILHSTDKILK
jgi:DNA-binding XRE family transcriptional regulator